MKDGKKRWFARARAPAQTDDPEAHTNTIPANIALNLESIDELRRLFCSACCFFSYLPFAVSVALAHFSIISLVVSQPEANQETIDLF